MKKKPGDRQRVENCLKLLLSSDYNLKVGIDDRDSSGNTALYIAVERRFQERATLLLINGAEVTVLKDGSKILSASLKMLKDILDDRLKIVSKVIFSYYEITNSLMLACLRYIHVECCVYNNVVNSLNITPETPL